MTSGELEIVDMDAFKRIIASLSDQDWVVYIEGPPSATSSPEHVLKYLARYLTGGPISDKRLIEESNGKVAFLARAGDYQLQLETNQNCSMAPSLARGKTKGTVEVSASASRHFWNQ